MDNIEMLINFGLTRQEATIYNLLFLEGKLNGYEAAKISGISRSNTYSALAGLVDKGAAYVIEEGAVYYTPVAIEEFCNNKLRFMNEIKEKLNKNIPRKREKTEGYITITGEKNISDKLINMLKEANERVYLAVDSERLEKYRKYIDNVIRKGIKVVVITNHKIEIIGAKLYYTELNSEHIRIIIDSRYVLTGEIEDEQNSSALFSSNNNLVQVFKEGLSNQIKLIEVNKGAEL